MNIPGSDEHTDCINWRNWARACDPHLSYPHKWSVPEGERQETTEDAERPWFDLNRALATDAIFTAWLRRYWEHQDRRAKVHFRILRASYLLGLNVGELDVLEALRALKDEKERVREIRHAKVHREEDQGRVLRPAANQN